MKVNPDAKEASSSSEDKIEENGTEHFPIDPDERNRYKSKLEEAKRETASPKQYQGYTTDKCEIYQGGKFALITPDSVLHNLQAIQLVFNELNTSNNELGQANKELRIIRSERVAYRCQPVTQIILSTVATISTALIAIGASRDPHDGLMIILGIVGFVVSNAANFIIPWNIRKQSESI